MEIFKNKKGQEIAKIAVNKKEAMWSRVVEQLKAQIEANENQIEIDKRMLVTAQAALMESQRLPK